MATVYIDVLFGINLIINILLIEASGAIWNEPSVWYRTLLSAVMGALYAVCIFFPNLGVMYTAAMKIVFSALIVLAAYRISSLKVFFRLWGTFYAVSFIFGGCVVAILSLTEAGARTGAIYSNGVFYLNLPWQALLGTSVAAYAFVVIFGRIRRKKVAREEQKRNVKIFLKGKSVSVTAIVDTGNSLFDPITGDPVIVCELAAIEKILPEGDTAPIEKLSEMGMKVRLVPFSSVGTEKGVMAGFLPDKVLLDEREAARCVVCLCETKLSNDRDYTALLNPAMTR